MLIGSLSGFLAGYLGIGGGLVVVPALTFLFNLDPQTAPWATHMAVATSLSSMLVTSLSSIVSHQRRKAIEWPVVRHFAPGLLAGAAGGALVADQLSKNMLSGVFGIFALLAGAQMLLGRAPAAQKPLPRGSAQSATGLFIGAVSSLVGIGGGSMTAPWLMWHGVRAQRAVATAAACGYPIALAGTLSFALIGPGDAATMGNLGYVHVSAWLGIALAGLLTAPLGVALVHRSPAQRVRRIFAVLMWVVAARMLYQAAT